MVATCNADEGVKLQVGAWKQVGNANTNLPAELVRRFDVVVKPSAKQRPLRLREVSADHIGRLVVLQVSPYMLARAQCPSFCLVTLCTHAQLHDGKT